MNYDKILDNILEKQNKMINSLRRTQAIGEMPFNDLMKYTKLENTANKVRKVLRKNSCN